MDKIKDWIPFILFLVIGFIVIIAIFKLLGLYPD